MKLAGSLPFLLALAPLASTACVADSLPVGMLDGPTGTGTGGSSGPSESSGGGTSVEPSPTTSDDGTTIAGADTDPSTGSTSDVPDDGLCDVFDPSCPSGQKCMPWSTDGGAGWNAWGCFPVDEDPVAVGETCLLRGEPWTGLDGCEEGSMCWDIDVETLEGTCVPFCIGSALDPTCADPARFCDISGDGTPYLCSPWCDPVAPDCPAGQGCYPESTWWTCRPPGGPGGNGAYGEPCGAIDWCEPGLVCRPPGAVPQCEDDIGCCSEVCDLGDPLGDAQCSGAAEGQTCQPWYDDGDAPAGLEHVGMCALP